jgi:hypothetical protein
LTPGLSKTRFEMLNLTDFFHTFIFSSVKRFMKSKSTTKTMKDIDNKNIKKSSNQNTPVVKKPVVNKVYAELADHGHEDFYSYLEWLGLAKKHDLLILTDSHHYYFEAEDLKNVKAVINLNQLNNIKKIKDFLQAIYFILPQKCHFIGSFTDSKTKDGFMNSKKSLHQIEIKSYLSESDESPWDSFLTLVYGLVDSKTNRKMSKKSVQFMFEDVGLKILDITEFNGLTYFCTQKDDRL